MAKPPVVSKRNEFYPADELVENWMPHLPDQFKHPDFRAWLLRYTETTIKSVASHFGIAAQRGIEQCAYLLCDPEYYETRRQKRTRWTKQMKEDQAKADLERWERQNCPTPEQIAQQIKWHEQEIAYSEKRLAEHQVAVAKLRATDPKRFTPGPRLIQ